MIIFDHHKKAIAEAIKAAGGAGTGEAKVVRAAEGNDEVRGRRGSPPIAVLPGGAEGVADVLVHSFCVI